MHGFKQRLMRFDIGLSQRCDHQLAFPVFIGGTLPMLQGATAAAAIPMADRLDAFWRGRDHPDQITPSTVTGDLDRFARKSPGHKHIARQSVIVGTAGDAVPLRPHAGNRQGLCQFKHG